MLQKMQPLGFEEAMLDWAAAEILSPMAWEHGFSYLGDGFRERLAAEGVDRLNPQDRQLALAALLHFRRRLLREFQINRSTQFFCHTLSVPDLAKLDILPNFGLGPLTLGQFAERIRCGAVPSHIASREIIERMLVDAKSGKTFAGRPFVVERNVPLSPVLLEGYKRSLVKLWLGGHERLEVILVRAAAGNP